MIYAIHCVGTNYVKFGKARRVKTRLVSHQISCPLELRVLAEADWPDEAEGRVHRLLKPQWVRGEWFSLTRETCNVIGLMKEQGGYSRLSTILDMPMANRRLKEIARLSKEDLGVWVTKTLSQLETV